jgi:hypothetical protein
LSRPYSDLLGHLLDEASFGSQHLANAQEFLTVSGPQAAHPCDMHGSTQEAGRLGGGGKAPCRLQHLLSEHCLAHGSSLQYSRRADRPRRACLYQGRPYFLGSTSVNPLHAVGPNPYLRV